MHQGNDGAAPLSPSCAELGFDVGEVQCAECRCDGAQCQHAFVAVDAGDGHTCGIKVDHTVACWGDDRYGESTLPEGTFSQVSAGTRHTCGVRADGRVACWGRLAR